MDQPTRVNPAPFVVLFIIGLATLIRFSQHVSNVEAVGLSGAGCALGVSVFGFLLAMRSRRKTPRT